MFCNIPGMSQPKDAPALATEMDKLAAKLTFSYGGQRGLLEVMGVIVDGKREDGDVKGWLTADDVIKMVEAHK